MSTETAKKSVDMVFRSPNVNPAIEFQGGEALLNWDTVKTAVLYAKKKNVSVGKNLDLSVVTNLTLMDGEKFDFLRGEGVSVCTSLDGPACLHNANRRFGNAGGHASVRRWLDRFMKAAPSGGTADFLPSALMTTTRLSLPMAAEIVDEYVSAGLGGIFIRPLSPIGHAGRVWDEIGYSPEEYGAFYTAALERVMAVNRSGKKFVERNAAMFSEKLFKLETPDYLDLMSPCGGAVGQLAYNWDGDIYTCDEGRMVGADNDALFRIGNVAVSKWEDLFRTPAARLCCMASCLENQPLCSRCAFKPYCGVCPVHNYSAQSSPWGNMRGSYWCGIQKAVFKAVLNAMTDPVNRKIILSWTE